MTLGFIMHNEPDEIGGDFSRLGVGVFEEATGRI
jgi:hypothetical protein